MRLRNPMQAFGLCLAAIVGGNAAVLVWAAPAAVPVPVPNEVAVVPKPSKREIPKPSAKEREDETKKTGKEKRDESNNGGTSPPPPPPPGPPPAAPIEGDLLFLVLDSELLRRPKDDWGGVFQKFMASENVSPRLLGGRAWVVDRSKEREFSAGKLPEAENAFKDHEVAAALEAAQSATERILGRARKPKEVRMLWFWTSGYANYSPKPAIPLPGRPCKLTLVWHGSLKASEDLEAAFPGGDRRLFHFPYADLRKGMESSMALELKP